MSISYLCQQGYKCMHLTVQLLRPSHLCISCLLEPNTTSMVDSIMQTCNACRLPELTCHLRHSLVSSQSSAGSGVVKQSLQRVNAHSKLLPKTAAHSCDRDRVHSDLLVAIRHIQLMHCAAVQADSKTSSKFFSLYSTAGCSQTRTDQHCSWVQ